MEKILNDLNYRLTLTYILFSIDEPVKHIKYPPIGIVRSPFKLLKDIPRQTIQTSDIQGVVEIFPECAAGLQGLDRFSHIILVCHFHLSEGFSLIVKPNRAKELPRGVFATRSPRRPNGIGISVVRLEKIEGRKIYFRDVDLADGTPILDIKPLANELEQRSEQIKMR